MEKIKVEIYSGFYQYIIFMCSFFLYLYVGLIIFMMIGNSEFVDKPILITLIILIYINNLLCCLFVYSTICTEPLLMYIDTENNCIELLYRKKTETINNVISIEYVKPKFYIICTILNGSSIYNLNIIYREKTTIKNRYLGYVPNYDSEKVKNITFKK